MNFIPLKHLIFPHNSGQASMNSDGSVTLTMNFESKITLSCVEAFIINDDSQYMVREVLLG